MIVLYNPHVDDFLGAPPHFAVLRRKPLKKYGFFIEQAIKNKQRINICVDCTISTLLPGWLFSRLPACVKSIIAAIEVRLWMWANSLVAHQVNSINPSEERPEDVLMAFSYKSAVGDFSQRRYVFNKYKCVVFHLSHYFISTEEKSENLKSVQNLVLAGDSDISENIYFKKYFFWYDRQFIVLPFSVSSRFKQITTVLARSPMALATGSIHDLRREVPAYKYRDFMAATGEDTYHPVRKLIYANSSSLKNKIDCRVSYYRDYSRNNFFLRLLAHVSVSQKKYFSLDIVALYNKYRFAIVGEELSGFPALGAFEAMACGNVLIAQPEYYKGLGIAPGQHYLAHEGTISSILEAMSESSDERLERISATARDFVMKNFSPAACSETWTRLLNDL